MLGYREEQSLPCCYIVEAGSALGQPAMLYLGESMDARISAMPASPDEFAWFDIIYSGHLRLDPKSPDSPKGLEITVQKPLSAAHAASGVGAEGKPPGYMRVLVRFQEQHGPMRDVSAGHNFARAVAPAPWCATRR